MNLACMIKIIIFIKIDKMILDRFTHQEINQQTGVSVIVKKDD